MVDVTHQIDAVQRTVGERQVEGRVASVVTVEQTYARDRADVWDAMTTADRIARWLLPVTGDLREGGRYQLEGNAGGTVLACVPPERLDLTWEYGGAVSWVTVTLTETVTDAGAGAGTTVRLEHAAHPDPTWDDFGPGAVGIGWDMALLGLSLHLSGGSLSGPEEAAGWQTSPEAVEFMRASAEG